MLSKLLSEKVAFGTGVVIACSALKLSYRNILRSLQEQGDRKMVTFVYLKGPFELFEERIKWRTGHFMPSTLLRSQFDTLQEPMTGEANGESFPAGHIVTIDASLSIQQTIEKSVKSILLLPDA